MSVTPLERPSGGALRTQMLAGMMAFLVLTVVRGVAVAATVAGVTAVNGGHMLNLIAAGTLVASLQASPIISDPGPVVPDEQITIDVITVTIVLEASPQKVTVTIPASEQPTNQIVNCGATSMNVPRLLRNNPLVAPSWLATNRSRSPSSS